MHAKWKVRYLVNGELAEGEMVGTLAEIEAACDGLEIRTVVWCGSASTGAADQARGGDAVSVDKG